VCVFDCKCSSVDNRLLHLAFSSNLKICVFWYESSFRLHLGIWLRSVYWFLHLDGLFLRMSLMLIVLHFWLCSTSGFIGFLTCSCFPSSFRFLNCPWVYSFLVSCICEIRRWKDILCSWIIRINTAKMPILLKAISMFNEMPLKFQQHSSQI
jgi:hypothetical protein